MSKSALAFCALLLVTFWVGIGIFIADFSREVNIAEALEASGALFTALAFAAAAYAVYLQRKSIEMQRQELELQRQELKDTREELKGQKEQLELQNSTLMKQTFENSIFKMIDIMYSYVQSMKYKELAGRECIDSIVTDFRLRCEHDARLNGKSTIEHVSQIYNGSVLKRADIWPYVNIVYRIIDRIDSEGCVGDDEKHLFCKMFRSQLSSGELALLVYHAALQDGADMLRKYFNKYEFMSHVNDGAFDKIVVDQFAPKAFGKSEVGM